jgi:methionyl-tRNA synthetase
LEDFPEKEDVLRYVLTANAPETKDNDFTWGDFQTRNNSELVGIFGNFINRVAVLTHKYYDGKVPEAENLQEIDKVTLEKLRRYPAIIAASIEKYKFREAQREMMNLARLGNKYIADEEPWKTIKTDEGRTQTVMFVALQISAALATLSKPFLPFTSEKLKGILKLEELTSWNNLSTEENLLPSGHQIGKAELLFSKVEDSEIEKQLQKLENTKTQNKTEENEVAPQKEMIQFDDFTKLDLRTGTILEAEKKPKTKKLMKLKVDTGLDQRTIVSGIAEHFKAEELVGKKVSVVMNLKPIKLRGTLSEGMILMTEDKNGKLVFVNPDESVDNGSVIN